MTDEIDVAADKDAQADKVAENDTTEAMEEKHVDWFEVFGTVLLGIAAVLIAWSTYQAQVWGGVQDTRNTGSALASVTGADELGAADAVSSLDQLLFVDWILKLDVNEDEAELLKSQMSADGAVASEEWLDNPLVRPFDSPAYQVALYGEGVATTAGAAALFDRASDANQNSDNYTLAATIVALVLFLSGVSLVLKGKQTRLVLVVSSGVILAGVLVYLVGLPKAGSAASVDEIKAAATERSAAARPIIAFTPSADSTAFAVYLEVFEAPGPDVPEGDLAELITEIENDRYYVFLNDDLSCDEGAAAGLGLDDGEYVAAEVYTPTIEDAERFATEYGVPLESIVEIQPSFACGFEFNLAVGDTAFAVYLEVFEAPGPDVPEGELAALTAEIESDGYFVSLNDDLSCDEGAAAGLGLGDGEFIAAEVYTPTIEDAEFVATQYGVPLENIVEIEVAC